MSGKAASVCEIGRVIPLDLDKCDVYCPVPDPLPPVCAPSLPPWRDFADVTDPGAKGTGVSQ